MKALSRTLRDYQTVWTKDQGLGFSGSDLTTMMTIWHNGAALADGTEVYSATIDMDGTDMTFKVNGSADTRLGVGGDGVIDYDQAAEDEYGNMYDAINAVPGWCCRLGAALRADRIFSTSAFVADTLSADTDCYQTPIDFKGQVGNCKQVGFCISNRRIITTEHILGDDTDKVAMIEDEGGAANLLEYLRVYIDAAAGALTLTLYSCHGNTENLIGTRILTVDTDETLDLTSCPLVAPAGTRLVGRIVAAGDPEDDPPLTIEALGKSIGGRWNA
jgi:hypothetical protein